MNALRPRMGPRHRRDHGMTLVELLAVLSILAILLGVGVPGMNRLVAGMRANSSMMELHALLSFARQNAIMMRRPITLCGTSNGSACASVWRDKPTLVFRDDNLNRTADTNEHILAVSELTRSARIRWSASGNRSYLRYRPDGGVSEIGSFVYCPKDNDPRAARAVIISFSGRARSAIDRNGDGINEDSRGAPLSCSG